jgi:hypothetical protein
MRKLTETAQAIEELLEGELQPNAESLAVHMKKVFEQESDEESRVKRATELALKYAELAK